MAISVATFGAVGDGVTNDRVAIQNALNSITTRGGTVELVDNKVYRISGGDLTIPRGVALKGSTVTVGARGTNAGADYNTQAGIVLDAAYSIRVKGGAGIDGILIRPYNMVFPQPNDLAYGGTAIIIDEDDSYVLNSMVIGFEQAIRATNAQRGRVERFNTDCINGIHVQTSWDIWYLREVHCWPFGTISSVTHGDVTRRGIGIMFSEGGDWNKITDCFTYGYARGVLIQNCNSMTLLNVSTDNVVNHARDAIGILLLGGCEDTRLIGCQAAASQRGIVISTNPGNRTLISEAVTWANAVGISHAGGGTVNVVNSITRGYSIAGIQNVGGGTLNQSLNLT